MNDMQNLLMSFSFASLLAAVTLGIWLYLILGRGRFWRADLFDADNKIPLPLPEWPRVVAIIPARNEAETIGKTIAGLAAQRYAGEFSIVIVDDHSEDRTAEIAKQTADETGARGRIKIIEAAALPDGWTGKLWALHQGVAAANEMEPVFYWFTDADIVHAPDTLFRLVGRAQHNALDLTSLMVLLQATTFPERLLIPPFLYFFLQLYPPAWIADPASPAAGAAGGCILLRRNALERIGGLEAIRDEVIDDCALARALKRGGYKIWMGLTRNSLSLRAYESFSEIRDMIARTAFTQLRYSAFLLAGTLAGLLLVYVAPLLLLFAHDPVARFLGGATWLLMLLSFFPTERFYKLSPLWAALLPLSAVFYGYATFLSAARYWLGRGGQWKGRAQAKHHAKS